MKSAEPKSVNLAVCLQKLKTKVLDLNLKPDLILLVKSASGKIETRCVLTLLLMSDESDYISLFELSGT